MYGSTIGRLNVYIRDHGGQETLLWRLAGDQGDQWYSASVPIASKLPIQVGKAVEVWMARFESFFGPFILECATGDFNVWLSFFRCFFPKY